MTEAAFCPFCGTKVDPAHSFCARCGKTLPSAAPLPTPQPPSTAARAIEGSIAPQTRPAVAVPEEADSLRSSRRWNLVWISGAFLTAVLVGVAFLLPSQSSGLANPYQAPVLIATIPCLAVLTVGVIMGSRALRLVRVKLPPELEARRKAAASRAEWWFLAGIILFFVGVAGQSVANAIGSRSDIGILGLVGLVLFAYGLVLDRRAGKLERKLKLEWPASQQAGRSA